MNVGCGESRRRGRDVLIKRSVSFPKHSLFQITCLVPSSQPRPRAVTLVVARLPNATSIILTALCHWRDKILESIIHKAEHCSIDDLRSVRKRLLELDNALISKQPYQHPEAVSRSVNTLSKSMLASPEPVSLGMNPRTFSRIAYSASSTVTTGRPSGSPDSFVVFSGLEECRETHLC